MSRRWGKTLVPVKSRRVLRGGDTSRGRKAVVNAHDSPTHVLLVPVPDESPIEPGMRRQDDILTPCKAASMRRGANFRVNSVCRHRELITAVSRKKGRYSPGMCC